VRRDRSQAESGHRVVSGWGLRCCVAGAVVALAVCGFGALTLAGVAGGQRSGINLAGTLTRSSLGGDNLDFSWRTVATLCPVSI
jgi:hypothetical protein